MIIVLIFCLLRVINVLISSKHLIFKNKILDGTEFIEASIQVAVQNSKILIYGSTLSQNYLNPMIFGISTPASRLFTQIFQLLTNVGMKNITIFIFQNLPLGDEIVQNCVNWLNQNNIIILGNIYYYSNSVALSSLLQNMTNGQNSTLLFLNSLAGISFLFSNFQKK